MLSVPTIDHLHEVTGVRRKQAAPAPAQVYVPAPVPAAPAPPAPTVDLSGLQAALMQIAAQQEENTRAVREFVTRPKKLKADIVRDDEGRMSEVIINIIEE